MKQAYYLYEANLSKGEMLLANDSSSFTRPFFESAQVGLKAFSNLSLSSSCLFFPSREGEDETMRAKRSDFRVADWMLLALVVDSSDEVASVLILERSNLDHCLVFSFNEGQVVVVSCQGMEIREEMEEKMTAKEFLSTLVVPSPVQSFSPTQKGKPTNLGYAPEKVLAVEEEDDEPLHIAFERPAFVPNSKKGKAANLGTSSRLIEEEEDDEPINIDVERQAFTPSSGKKPRNLNVYIDRRPQKPIKKEDVDDDEAVNIEISKEGFVAGNSKKPKNLNVYKTRKVQAAPKAISVEEPDPAKIASSYKKPDFSPNVQIKSVPHQASFEKPSSPNQRSYSQSDAAEASSNQMEERVSSPKYYFSCEGAHRLSRTAINDPSLFYVHKVFDGRWKRILTENPKVTVDDSAIVFGKVKKPDGHFVLDMEKYDILAANVDESNEPFAYLLSRKENPSIAMALLRKEAGFALLCLSDTGIEILDPRLDYDSLRRMCFPDKGAN